MDQVAIIRNHKDSHISFDLDVQGVDATEGMMVRFCFRVDGVIYSFDCNRGDDKKFHCVVPPLKHIARTTYPAWIEVIVDGYFFQPMTGVVNITADPLVNVNPPAPEMPKVAVVPEKELPKPTQPVLKQHEKSIAQLAQEAVGKLSTKAKDLAKPTTETKVEEKQASAPKAKVTVSRLSEEEKARLAEEAKKHVKNILAETKTEPAPSILKTEDKLEENTEEKKAQSIDAEQIRNIVESIKPKKEPRQRSVKFKKGDVIKG